ncbi:TlpA family protein disulfide reductase [Leptolyngbya sp. 15MV]|nr:TlpA family protein disulfide reductase [Leptolyngbya sp. 15MV]
MPKAEREKLRQTVLGIVDTALSDASPSDAAAQRRIASLERLKARLNGAAMRGELIGHEAPAIEFTWASMEPAPKSFADFKGKIVVVDFWATWCGPCIAAFPKMAEKVERYKGLPVVVLGVTSIQGSHTNLRATDPKERRIDTRDDPAKEMALMTPYMKEMGMTWPVVFSKQDVFNPDFGVNGIPHVAIIDASGKVRFNGLHPMNPEVEKRIDELLVEMGHTPPPKKSASAEPKN